MAQCPARFNPGQPDSGVGRDQSPTQWWVTSTKSLTCALTTDLGADLVMMGRQGQESISQRSSPGTVGKPRECPSLSTVLKAEAGKTRRVDRCIVSSPAAWGPLRTPSKAESAGRWEGVKPATSLGLGQILQSLTTTSVYRNIKGSYFKIVFFERSVVILIGEERFFVVRDFRVCDS